MRSRSSSVAERVMAFKYEQLGPWKGSVAPSRLLPAWVGLRHSSTRNRQRMSSSPVIEPVSEKRM